MRILRLHRDTGLLSRPPRSTTARAGTDDAGFALIFSLLFILILSTFCLFLLSTVTEEVRQTQFSRKHEQTLNSAIAGLNAGLTVIRNSINPGTRYGVLSALPCTTGTKQFTLIGSTNASGGQTWQTQIYYLTTTPVDMTLAQVQAAALSCPLATLPTYAYLQSTGQQAAIYGAVASVGNRTVHATYQLSTLNASNAGGQLSYNGNCLDAGSAPAVGSSVTFQPCLAAGTAQQIWYYRGDMSIIWAGDQTANLCLDYRTLPAAPTVTYVTLQTCIGTGQSGTAYNSLTSSYPLAGEQYQEFSSNNVWNTVGSSGDTGSYCLNSYTVAAQAYGGGAVGDQLVLDNSVYCNGYGAAALSVSPGVGSGGAGGIDSGLPGPTQQLVNFLNSQYCLDVRSNDPGSGLILWPCHQAPDPTKIAGNQQFQYYGTTTSPGTIQTFGTTNRGWSPPYTTVCFQSNTGSVVQLVTCVPGQAEQRWLMTGYLHNDYADSYEIQDYRGWCLQAGVSMQPCNGTDAQKWNAPPGGLPTSLKALGEP